MKKRKDRQTDLDVEYVYLDSSIFLDFDLFFPGIEVECINSKHSPFFKLSLNRIRFCCSARYVYKYVVAKYFFSINKVSYKDIVLALSGSSKIE